MHRRLQRRQRIPWRRHPIEARWADHADCDRDRPPVPSVTTRPPPAPVALVARMRKLPATLNAVARSGHTRDPGLKTARLETRLLSHGARAGRRPDAPVAPATARFAAAAPAAAR